MPVNISTCTYASRKPRRYVRYVRYETRIALIAHLAAKLVSDARTKTVDNCKCGNACFCQSARI